MSVRAGDDPFGGDWAEAAPSAHRDHVVAHVIGATALGYFVHSDALHVLLDIGFFWIVYLDCEMGLVAESLAISDLDAGPDFRALVAADADALRDADFDALAVMRAAPAGCTIEEVSLYERGERRRLFVRGEQSCVVVETSTETRGIAVEAC